MNVHQKRRNTDSRCWHVHIHGTRHTHVGANGASTRYAGKQKQKPLRNHGLTECHYVKRACSRAREDHGSHAAVEESLDTAMTDNFNYLGTTAWKSTAETTNSVLYEKNSIHKVKIISLRPLSELVNDIQLRHQLDVTIVYSILTKNGISLFSSCCFSLPFFLNKQQNQTPGLP